MNILAEKVCLAAWKQSTIQMDYLEFRNGWIARASVCGTSGDCSWMDTGIVVLPSEPISSSRDYTTTLAWALFVMAMIGVLIILAGIANGGTL